MNIWQKLLLSIYGVLVFIFGILRVPAYAVWGPEKEISSGEYIPIWQLTKSRHFINGFTPVYEVDYWRVIIVIGVLTLITYVLYLILKEENINKR